jgi:hypothetical protein
MKKVLVITYYWPPSGGAGVQRWLKFVKYLRDFGWEPIIYTPENPESPAIDNSLEKDIPDDIAVVKTPINEPYTAYKKFVGRKKDDKIKAGFLSENKKPSITEKVAVWVRGNFFIPDARKFWIKPSIRFLNKWITTNLVDAIVSTGPPHSMHLIAEATAEKNNIPWLADFRDPWTNIDFYKDLMLTKKSDLKHQRLEKGVLTKAKRVVVISRGMAKDFRRLHPRDYDIITNGFDSAGLVSVNNHSWSKFTIAHIGSMVPARNPVTFWKAIHELIQEDAELDSLLEIKLVGQVDYSVKENIAKLELEKYVQLIDYLPHEEVIKLQQQIGVLLLVVNRTPNAKMVVTGKIFEYLNSGRPVLCIGPTDGDAAAILSDTNTGLTCDYDDLSGIKNAIRSFFVDYKAGKLTVDGQNIEQYARKNLTAKMAKVLNEMTA